MPAATPAPRRLPGQPPEDACPADGGGVADIPELPEDPPPTDDPWLDEPPGPPPWPTDDPGPDDPDDVLAWLDAELAKAAPWLDDDPGWDGPALSGPCTPGPPGSTTPAEVFKAGRWDRTRGDGGGFAAGGLADHLPPGPVLAGLAADRWRDGLDRLSDDELIGVLRAARRLASWATAMELAATSDLWRRRSAEEEAGDSGAALHADAEIAAALTLTRCAADQLLGLATALRRLPATSRALTAGDIDPPRAKVIADEVSGLTDEHAAAVEAAIIAAAGGQTTGQLRQAVRRAVLAADPAAARRRKDQALRQARVERWAEPAGTAALAGRDLPPAAVLAADANLTALAKQLKAAGGVGTLDTLRAQIYLALLTGAPVSSLLPTGPSQTCPPSTNPAGQNPANATSPSSGPATDHPAHNGPATTSGPGADHPPAWPRDPGALHVTGHVNLTLPLVTWLGHTDIPGHAAGYGPLDGTDARTLANALAAQPSTHWCLTLTGPDGRPVAHGCARTGPPASSPATSPSSPGISQSEPDNQTRNRLHTGPCGEPEAGTRSTLATGPPRRPRTRSGGEPGARARAPTWTFTLTPLTGGDCDHEWEAPAYQPPAALRHLVNLRHATCVFPGCRRPAAQCDADHTLAYHHGGKTCLCNLAPLCRYHHQVKQAPGWILEHTTPGTLTWTAPSGRRYTTTPTKYRQ